GVYRVLKPCLLAAYERHLGEANPVYEPPTRRILQRCIGEERRHIAAGESVLRHLTTTPELAARAAAWAERARVRLAGTAGRAGDGVVAFAPPSVAEDVPEVAQALVQLEKPLGRWAVLEDLPLGVAPQARAALPRGRCT